MPSILLIGNYYVNLDLVRWVERNARALRPGSSTYAENAVCVRFGPDDSLGSQDHLHLFDDEAVAFLAALDKVATVAAPPKAVEKPTPAPAPAPAPAPPAKS